MKKDKEKQLDHENLAEHLRTAAEVVRYVTQQTVKRWPKGYGIEKHPDYLAAVDFMVNFHPQEGKNYDWAWGYAEELYKQLNAAYKELDDKADALIKYL